MTDSARPPAAGAFGDDRVPVVDAATLLAEPGPRRAAFDDRFLAALGDIGFVVLTGLPPDVVPDAARRARLLAVFGLPEAERRKLARRRFAPGNRNVYRGWFPPQPGEVSFKEGYDMGPDAAAEGRAPVMDAPGRDPLAEPTPWPARDPVPGWRAAIAAHAQAMDRLGRALIAAIARALGVPERGLAAPFEGGNSTLRLLRYPVPDGEGGRRTATEEHTDSGCLTLLCQDGVAGLQARRRDGAWIPVPPVEGSIAVNAGDLLERWTGGRIVATPHRVIDPGGERYSIPYFFEPALDAEIAPLPGLSGAADFEPVRYRAYLLDKMQHFAEFRGLLDGR